MLLVLYSQSSFYIQCINISLFYFAIPFIFPSHLFIFPDLPVHPEQVLPFAGSAIRYPIQPCDRYVESWLYIGWNAHRRTAVQWSQWSKSLKPLYSSLERREALLDILYVNLTNFQWTINKLLETFLSKKYLNSPGLYR